VDLRAGLDDLEKRKFLTLPRLELGPLDREVPIGTEDKVHSAVVSP
jgi:hypothetical protein